MRIRKKYQYSEVIKKGKITFYGNSIDEITSDVIRIRKKNGISTGDYNLLYNLIKKKISQTQQVDGVDSEYFDETVRQNSKRNNTKYSRSVSIRDAASAAKALMKIIHGEYVNEEEYKRRLSICSSCPLRQKNSDCMGCGGSGKAARNILEFRAKLGLSYNIDSNTGSHFCGFCGCSLSLLLVTKVENYKKEEEEINNQRPGHCWLRKTSINYVR